MVRRDIAQAQGMIDAFSDKNLRAWAKTQSATQSNWKIEEYTKKVAEKAFPPVAAGKDTQKGNGKQSAEGTSDSPMWTDPVTGKLVEKWELSGYIKRGWPAICREADLRHEQVHHDAWEQNKRFYGINMEDPDKLAEEEIQAYGVKIAFLRNWLESNCQLRSKPAFGPPSGTEFNQS